MRLLWVFIMCGLMAPHVGLALAETPVSESLKTSPGPKSSSMALQRLASAVDRLGVLQDDTARGRVDAAQAQKRLLVEIGETLRNFPDEDAERAVPLVICYVLSGGDPEGAERLSKLTAVPFRERSLLEAAGLFMRGDREAARHLLEEVDALALSPRLSGRVALAQALLEPPGDARQDRLAVAMGAMPGTLVEESALRRSALGYSVSREERKMWARLDRYGRRFSQSLYARSLWEDIVDEIVAWGAKGSGPDLTYLDSILASLPIAQRRSLYIRLARRSAAVQNAAFTEFAGRRFERLALEGTMENESGRLYSVLFGIVSPAGETALSKLAALHRDMLLPPERGLLDAALALGRQIDQPLSNIHPLAPGGVGEKDPLQIRGETLLEDTRKLLAEVSS